MQTDGMDSRYWIRFAAGVAAGVAAMALFVFRWPPNALFAPLLGVSAVLTSSRRRGDRVESPKDRSTVALVVVLSIAALVFVMLMFPAVGSALFAHGAPQWLRALAALTWLCGVVLQLRTNLRAQFRATESM